LLLLIRRPVQVTRRLQQEIYKSKINQ